MPIDNVEEWVVVLPSIRQVNWEYLAAIPTGVKLMIVDDSDGTITARRENTDVFVYSDYRRVLGDEEAIIPRKTDTCRSFGFYMAWREGYRFVLTLDDDCQTHAGFLHGHAILGQELSVKSVNSVPWFNTLDNLVLENGHGRNGTYYSRGYPYRYRHQQPNGMKLGRAAGRVVCNVGLWLGVPDMNGLDKIGEEPPTSVALVEERLAVAPGTSFSLTIMNVAFLSELVPAFYQLPMGVQVCNAKLDRFGDIWSGYILKKLTDIRGDLVTSGIPLVTHTKAGNTVHETQVEHYGHLMEAYFYELIDQAAEGISPASYAEMYHHLAQNLGESVARAKLPDGYRTYLREMSNRMLRWAHLFC